MAVHGTTLRTLAGSKTRPAYVFVDELTHLRANHALPLSAGLLFRMLLGTAFLKTGLAIAIMSTLRVAGTTFGAAHNIGRWRSNPTKAKTYKDPCAQHRNAVKKRPVETTTALLAA